MSGRPYFINNIAALYEALKKAGREEEAKKIARDFLNKSFSEDLDKKVERLLRIPQGIFPADMEYFRLLWELNQIYINGLYYSTAVMAGVLCERMCHDILAKNSIKAKGEPCLGDLIKLLTEKNLIKGESKAEMEKIREKRNLYVHPTERKPDTERDALEMIESISKILQNEFQLQPS